MAPALEKMTDEEKTRNRHGPHLLFEWTEQSQGGYPSSIPGFFPDIVNNHAKYVTASTRCGVLDRKSVV